MSEKVDFNNYSDSYIKLMEEQHSKYGDITYYSVHKVKLTKKHIKDNIQTILEFGCGIGRNLPELQEQFKNSELYGYDISTESLEIANKNNPNVTFIKSDNLEEYNNSFDLIFIAGVYHHIQPQLRSEVTSQIVSLLKENGKIICFEHNPYNPLTRHMVNTCEFDKDAVLLSLSETINTFTKHNLDYIKGGYTLFVPPKLKKFNFIESFFQWLPLGGQYFSIYQKGNN